MPHGVSVDTDDKNRQCHDEIGDESGRKKTRENRQAPNTSCYQTFSNQPTGVDGRVWSLATHCEAVSFTLIYPSERRGCPWTGVVENWFHKPSACDQEVDADFCGA